MPSENHNVFIFRRLGCDKDSLLTGEKLVVCLFVSFLRGEREGGEERDVLCLACCLVCVVF